MLTVHIPTGSPVVKNEPTNQQSARSGSSTRPYWSFGRQDSRTYALRITPGFYYLTGTWYCTWYGTALRVRVESRNGVGRMWLCTGLVYARSIKRRRVLCTIWYNCYYCNTQTMARRAVQMTLAQQQLRTPVFATHVLRVDERPDEETTSNLPCCLVSCSPRTTYKIQQEHKDTGSILPANVHTVTG